MLDLGRHGGYILASYAVTIVIIGGIVWQTVAQYRAARTAIAKTAIARTGERSDG